MSRFPFIIMLTVLLSLTGCMHQPPMYQPSPYGQQMYGAPGGYVQPGTLVIPPSSAPPYQPGSTYDNSIKPDDFKRENGSNSDGKFYEGDGGVPPAKDPDPTNAPFTRDLGT